MILHVFHRQHSLNLPKAVLSLSLLSFEKMAKKSFENGHYPATYYFWLMLLHTVRKKNWI